MMDLFEVLDVDDSNSVSQAEFVEGLLRLVLDHGSSTGGGGAGCLWERELRMPLNFGGNQWNLA